MRSIPTLLLCTALVACGGTDAPADHMQGDRMEADHMQGDHMEADHEGADHAHDEGDHAHEGAEPEIAFHPAPAGASVKFVAPADGATVTSPVKVEMGVEGMQVQAAGEVTEGTGHHHIIIDGEAVPKGEVVPTDDQHIHFGGGQTETEVELEPGEHTLRLQFADGIHRSYGEAVSTAITVTVEE